VTIFAANLLVTFARRSQSQLVQIS